MWISGSPKLCPKCRVTEYPFPLPCCPLAAPLPAAALSPMGGGEGGGGSWFDKLQRTKVPATKDHSLNKHCFSFNKK